MRLYLFGIEYVLARGDKGKALLDALAHPGHFRIGKIRCHWRVFQCLTAGPVLHSGGRSGCRWEEYKRLPHRILFVLADADDDNPVPCLRDAVLLELIKMRIDAVASRLHVGKNFLECFSLIRARKAAHVLREEPARLVGFQHADAVGIERPVFTGKSLLLLTFSASKYKK